MKEYKCKECGDKIETLTKKYSCEKEVEVHKNCEFCEKDFIYIKLCGKKKRKIPKTCSKECAYKLGNQKAKKTFLDKYGVDNISKTQEFKDFMKKETIFTTNEFKENLKKKNLKKYGVEHYTQTEEFKKKSQKTLRKNYNVDNPMRSKEIQDKRREDNLRRYNVDHIAKFSPYQEERRKKAIAQNRVNNNATHIKNVEDFNNFYDYITMNPNQTVYDLAEYFNVNIVTIKGKAKDLKITHLIKNFNKFSSNEEVYQSFFENNFKDLEILYRDRKQIYPLELDFYIPSLNLAIEINPTWTHSFNSNNFTKIKDKTYHYNKFKKCKEKGIELISIFEWYEESKVKKFLKNKIENSFKIIYARNCKINLSKKLNKKHKRILFENHISEEIENNKEYFVVELIYNKDIVGFGVFYKNSSTQVELKRLIFNDSYTVVGGTSKIIKNLFRLYPEIEEITTFTENNLGTGNVYKKVGFEIQEEIKYSLFLSNSRKNIHKRINNENEYEKMINESGFLPVYDCGKTKWILKRSSCL